MSEPRNASRGGIWAQIRLATGIALLAFQPTESGWGSAFNLCLGVLLVAIGAAELESRK